MKDAEHKDRFSIIDFSRIGDVVEHADGFPRVDWDAVEAWIDEHIDESQLEAAWSEAAFQWLERVHEQLGDRYKFYDENGFYLLCPYGWDRADSLLATAMKARDAICRHLRDIPDSDPVGPEVILVFHDQDTYYTYVSYFYPDGEHGFSGGMQIRAGYPHIVLPHGDPAHHHRAVVHELTHRFLAQQGLPAWVEEGLAQVLEDLVLGVSWFTLTREDSQREIAYWSRHGLDAFWAGDAFSRSDEAQQLSYKLAQIMVRNMSTDHRDRFFDFLEGADACDAGEAAALKHLGMSLGDIAAQFLGFGDWSPKLDDAGRLPDRQSDDDEDPGV